MDHGGQAHTAMGWWQLRCTLVRFKAWANEYLIGAMGFGVLQPEEERRADRWCIRVNV